MYLFIVSVCVCMYVSMYECMYVYLNMPRMTQKIFSCLLVRCTNAVISNMISLFLCIGYGHRCGHLLQQFTWVRFLIQYILETLFYI